HWKDHGKYSFKGLPEALEVVEVGEDDVAPLHAPKSGRTAKKILPWWRRPLTLAAEAAMLLIGIGVGTWFLLQSPPTLAFAARDWVVVGDLHNLTGDTVFDQSVDSALHISLEQSHYVNVLPELSVQQTLQRMELNPDKTNVNRAIGSQVALREGARALILPTIAEVGGRVRVTAEVIDPNTQTTVYSVSADGVGAQSVLPSLDSVSKQLRGKLGEALAMVSRESQPLDKVATPNLDALRSYSLGVRAHAVGNFKDARALFEHAIELDPGFARARLELAATLFDANQRGPALDQLHIAATLKDRMTQRDSMLVDAWLGSYASARDALQKWKLLADLYPDLFVASGRYGYYEWMYANDFDIAKTAIERSASPHNPNRVNSDFMLGMLALGQEQYTQAMKFLAIAESEGWNRTEYVAAAYAAQRKYRDADHAIARAKPSGIPSDDIDASVMRITIALDQGHWNDALKQLNAALVSAHQLGASQVRRFTGIKRSLSSLLMQTDNPGTGKGDVKRVSGSGLSPAQRADEAFQQLWVAYLLARGDDARQAATLLEESDAETYASDFPVLRNMLDVARAEVMRAQGHAEDAIKLLAAGMNGNELYVTHVALMDAYASAKDYPPALREAKWLASHRGRAYAEYNQAWTLTPFNVVQSDLALLNSAEICFAMGDKEAARSDLSAFLSIWPDARNPPDIKRRTQKLAEELANS
ncbi:MAG TPA: putative peptide modification system cyclase, partial [Rhodanobacteraceae bacterium]|nr:putative peptide modification system cyclase [Rhodanobacteraceae bacterium]